MKLSWRGSVVVAIICLFLVLVACGDDDSDFISRPEKVSSSETQSSSSLKKNSSSSAKEASSSSSLSESTLSPCRGEDNDDCKYDTLYDERDGQTYKIVKIGKQWWMAENLNYKTDSSFCYKWADSNCTKYGRLYPWGDVVHGRGCPHGWALPTSADIFELERTVGQDLKVLFSNEYEGATDEYGFSVKMGGYFYIDPDAKDVSEGTFYGENETTYFWDEDVDDSHSTNWRWNLEILQKGIQIGGGPYKNNWHSVRCIQKTDAPYYMQPCKTDSTDSCEYGTLTDDRDGQTYKTVKVGTQTWMAENLNYEMENSSCYWKDSLNCIEKGRLYSAISAQSACPKGWHLPAWSEWRIFDKVTGFDYNAWQAKGVGEWTNGTDKYGFSAIPSGSWNHDYGCYFWGDSEVFFCVASEDGERYEVVHLYNVGGARVEVNDDALCSVRCIKDED